MTHNGVCIRVYGKVQGVGFRPFVWQLAQQLNLTGDVCNDARGVEVRLWGDERRFLPLLYQQCLPLARIDDTQVTPYQWPQAPLSFTIRERGRHDEYANCARCRHLSRLSGGDE